MDERTGRSRTRPDVTGTFARDGPRTLSERSPDRCAATCAASGSRTRAGRIRTSCGRMAGAGERFYRQLPKCENGSTVVAATGQRAQPVGAGRSTLPPAQLVDGDPDPVSADLWRDRAPAANLSGSNVRRRCHGGDDPASDRPRHLRAGAHRAVAGLGSTRSPSCAGGSGDVRACPAVPGTCREGSRTGPEATGKRRKAIAVFAGHVRSRPSAYDVVRRRMAFTRLRPAVRVRQRPHCDQGLCVHILEYSRCVPGNVPDSD